MSKKKKLTEVEKLTRAVVLNQAFKRLVKYNEVDAYDGPFKDWLKLKDELVPKYGPVVQLLAQAGMISFTFNVSKHPLFMEHYLEFDANDAFENGIISLQGDEPPCGSSLGDGNGSFCDSFDMLCRGLPDHRDIEKERLERRVRDLKSELEETKEQGGGDE